MGLGDVSGGGFKNYYYLKARVKKGNETDPHFQVQKKLPSGNYEDQDTVASVSGKVLSLGERSFVWEDETVQMITIGLSEGDDVYNLSFNVDSQYGRSIMNSLLGVELIGHLEVSLYVSNKGYASISLKGDGERLNWKYAISELPEAKEVKFKNKTIRDYTESNEKLFHEWVQHPMFRDFRTNESSDGDIGKAVPNSEETVAEKADDFPF